MLLFKGKKDLRVLNILKNSLSFLKNWKVFLVAVFFVLYTVVILGFGYILQRNDYYGLVLKPALLQNYRMVVNYFNSFSVDPEKLILDIKHRHYMKLAYKRQEALEAGTLPKSPDDWVPATLSHRGKKVEIDIRLKGNGIEHWKHKNYWSFKVKVKGNKTLFGMKRLALQQPKVRTFMNEWYWHKLLKYSGLIYMRYNFVDLTVNGKHYSIYAIEENYGKRLIENNHLKDGPIFWAGLSPVGTLKATSAYQSKQYKRDILQAAESRLEAYRQGDLQLSKVFDVEEWARLVAIADLVGSRHSLTIGNIKLYYNPVTGLISPIGNDSSIPLSRQKEFNFLGEEQRFVEGSEDANSLTYWKWPLGLFQDKTFFKKYIESLEEISDKIFLDRFFLEISKEEREAIKILHRAYPYYAPNFRELVYKNREYIKKNLQPIKPVNAYFDSISKEKRVLILDIGNTQIFPIEIVGIFFAGDSPDLDPDDDLRRTMQSPEKGGKRLINYKIKPEIYGIKLNLNTIKPLEKTVLQAKRIKDITGEWHRDVTHLSTKFNRIKNEVLKEIKTLANLMPMVSGSKNEAKTNQKSLNKKQSGLDYKKISFRIPPELKWSDDLIPRIRVVSRVFGARFKSANEIIPWARHEDMFAQSSNVSEVLFMSVDEENKLIRISQGEWTVDQDIIIPREYRVIAKQGTHLNLINGSKILSYSALEFSGSKEKPVIISSEGKSGQGIIVIEANRRSMIQNTIFDGLSNPRQAGWELSGAVTFYESDVTFSDVMFINNRSEDALNVIRSNFTLEDTEFRNTAADGLDLDFSNGIIKNISFFNCKNDGLDVSGGDVNVKNIFYNQIGDKGISAGEKSRVVLEKLIGKNSRIAVASKDQSEVFIQDANIVNSQIGFAVFQKKPEFGPGKIQLKNVKISNTENSFLVEKGSTLLIDGTPVLAKVSNLGKLLYGSTNQ